MKTISKIPKSKDQGPDVITLQQALVDKGYTLKVDGIFGARTKQAVSRLQLKNGLKGSGIIGVKTLALLFITVGVVNSTPAPIQSPAQPKPPVVANPSKVMSRDQMLAIYIGIIDGTIKTKYGPYNNWREDNQGSGKNKSRQISPMVIRQGGTPGDAYCQYGQQDLVDAFCEVVDIPRRLFRYPEGGSTQTVFSLVPKEFIVSTPLPMCLWTVQYNKTWKGHIELLTAIRSAKAGQTFGFNTNIDGDDRVVRDGQGSGYCERPFFASQKVHGDLVELKGYVDLYAIYLDAVENKDSLTLAERIVASEDQKAA